MPVPQMTDRCTSLWW